ncbi:hypothetical protein HDV01_005598 [Terramyces sp. JEL0728]|nr:hypothetical protein HDV01_005598 [Terramyces sp. JEL0728]
MKTMDNEETAVGKESDHENVEIAAESTIASVEDSPVKQENDTKVTSYKITEGFGDFGFADISKSENPPVGNSKSSGFANFASSTGFDTKDQSGFAFESKNQGFAAFETNNTGFGESQNDNGFADFKAADAGGFDDFKDDFGDFGETANDFGDFEETANDFGDFEETTEMEPVTDNSPVFPPVEKHEKESNRITLLLPHETDPFLSQLNQDIENAFVITKELESIPLPDKLYEQKDLIEPTSNDDWTQLLKKLQTENIYNDPDIFRWRKSLIRTKFLDSISKTVTKAERTAQQTEELPKSTDALADFREVELQGAKKLCDISEDEIRKKSKTELRELVQTLQKSLQQMQEQTNYWLDSKEQLVMDAEMHNKMIASLVTYAQQQQQPKGEYC